MSLLRIFIALTLFSAAFALVRYASSLIDRSGPGLYPGICVVAAFFLGSAALALLFPSVRTTLFHLWRWIVELFVS